MPSKDEVKGRPFGPPPRRPEKVGQKAGYCIKPRAKPVVADAVAIENIERKGRQNENPNPNKPRPSTPL